MNPTGFRARRATLDDLDPLKRLWESLRLDGQELEKRLTEFQVAEGPDGRIVGAVALQIAGRHGWIHSEVFEDFSVAEQVRPALWDRIQSLCRNHGVFRLWTREDAPFWSRNGLLPPGVKVLEKLPAVWDPAAPGWLSLQLRDEDAIASIDREFAVFVETEKRKTAEAIERARTVKMILTGIVLFVAVILAGAAVYFLITRKSRGG